ncbi:MAG: DUF1722 domain-containing protein [Magnetococcales bacterium]|nr:DUF1722 domain-containing protein [Magnetococcales bacterium]MBF0155757.1 DUF1722 domain-containing protein [Magnetococcales bacterium]
MKTTPGRPDTHPSSRGNPPPIIGVSACLCGHRVRYDGTDRRESFVADTLARHCRLLPICPELQAGLGLPREPIRLEGNPGSPRVVSVNTRRDLTDHLSGQIEETLDALAGIPLSGFLFKGGSPSCGSVGVPVHAEAQEENTHRPIPAGAAPGLHPRAFLPVPGDRATPLRSQPGMGLFARALKKRLPLLPIADIEALRDETARAGFIERLFVYGRWSAASRQARSPTELSHFHHRHRLLVRLHRPGLLRPMEHLLASITDPDPRPREQVRDQTWGEYGELLMRAVAHPATRHHHERLLGAILRTLKKRIAADDQQAIEAAIGGFTRGDLPRIVPITLINHVQRRIQHPSLTGSWYLEPDPTELALSCHA